MDCLKSNDPFSFFFPSLLSSGYSNLWRPNHFKCAPGLLLAIIRRGCPSVKWWANRIQRYHRVLVCFRNGASWSETVLLCDCKLSIQPTHHGQDGVWWRIKKDWSHIGSSAFLSNKSQQYYCETLNIFSCVINPSSSFRVLWFSSEFLAHCTTKIGNLLLFLFCFFKRILM